MNERKSTGKVYLVGAGPGDPELITIKGHKLLSRCDVIIYDALVNPELLSLTKAETRLIFVGESRSAKRFTQDEINQLMIFEASEGNLVVRLKGGDPFVFGRGVEEAIALNNAGIEWEVVPGISSGIAVPAYAGIPLTHRGISSSTAFLTGHERIGKNKSVDIAAIAASVDTLVIFMGSKNLHSIAENLLASGMNKNTPIAVIEKGTCIDQNVTISSLEEIIVIQQEFKSPALIVIGEVVSLREKILLSKINSKSDFKSKDYIEKENEVLSYIS